MRDDLSRRSASGAKADRDHILEHALKHELSAAATPPTPACLDAETLAAWEDGALGADAMQIAEVHLSTCGRCQSLVGVLARSTPLARGTKAPGTFFRWWLAPLAAATAAATMWMVVPRQQQIALAPPPIATPKRDADAPLKEKVDAPRDRVQTPAAPFADRDDRREPQAPARKNKEEDGKLVAQEKLATSADAAAPATAPPVAPSIASLQKNAARALAAPVEIISPDPSRRWRIVATGVEYSTSAGASWTPVRAAGIESLTGGIAPAGTIAWLVGKAGAVLVTADGTTFARVDLPVAADISAISAADARSAVVTTGDGRTFRTDDSGRSWRRN